MVVVMLCRYPRIEGFKRQEFGIKGEVRFRGKLKSRDFFISISRDWGISDGGQGSGAQGRVKSRDFLIQGKPWARDFFSGSGGRLRSWDFWIWGEVKVMSLVYFCSLSVWVESLHWQGEV